MSEDLKMFSSSLREYLVNSLSDAHNTKSNIVFKYNNLKVWMEPKRFKIPHFWVSFNISAACFQISPVEVISGGMGAEERYVRIWANRPNISAELQKTWAIEAKNNSFNIVDAKNMSKKRKYRR